MRATRRKRQSMFTSLTDCLEMRTLLASDFGDAPAPYPVTLAENGASHTVTLGTPRFGSIAVAEADGAHSTLADGEADDNGIEFAELIAGQPGSVRFNPQNVGGGGGFGAKIDAWMDFNTDGDWADAGEQIFDGLPVANFQNTFFEFAIPATAVSGYTFARSRISVSGNLEPTGAAPEGEVQDDRVFIKLPPPIITAPAQASAVNVTGTNRVTISWTPVNGALNYDVWINYGTQSQWHRATVPGTSYTPNQDFLVGEYTLWIRSLGTAGLISAWSPERNFGVTSQPTIVPMQPVQNTFQPTITWNPVPGATEYQIWISDLTLNRPVIRLHSLETTSYTPTQDLPLGSYRVWVSIETPVLWSLPVDFRIAVAPVLTGGTNSTFDRTPTFSWNSLPGATSYEFQMRNQNTGVTVINQIGIAGTTFTAASALPDGPYRWWVRAKVTANTYGPWTAPTDIYIGGRTTVLTPVGTSNQSIPTFTWRPVDGAALYQLWVTRTGGPVVINEIINTGETSYVPKSALAPGTYRIWVMAITSTNEQSPWSLEVNYTVVTQNSNAMPDLTLEETRLAPALPESLICFDDRKSAGSVKLDPKFDRLSIVRDDTAVPVNAVELLGRMAAEFSVATEMTGFAEVDWSFANWC